MPRFRLGNRLVFRAPFPTLRGDPRDPPVLTRRPAVPSLDPDKIAQLRKVDRPYDRHLTPCYHPPAGELPDLRRPPRGAFEFPLMPRPIPSPAPRPSADLPSYAPQWNSVALFFNLDMPAADRPDDYAATTVATARTFLDEGPGALSPGISESLTQYWGALSNGAFAFGLNTPRDGAGKPLIPDIAPPGGDVQAWEELIRRCVKANAQAIWQAAGGLMKNGKRWIPSLVLVQNYWTHASARFGGYDIDVSGTTYTVGDVTHIRFGLDTYAPPEAPGKVGRTWWGTLNHEYAHNFLEFWDLYGPSGCTGYWDLLGDNSPPGRMSEVSSLFKERMGWLSFKQVIEGPNVSRRTLSLRPYTTDHEAIKVVPDPEFTPHEYFLLEYRKSTGAEVWRPDGGLPEEGLLITHVNDRIGVPSTWLLRDAPFFNTEFADAGGPNVVDWHGHKELTGKLFPQGAQNSFTPATAPSSNLYGPRNSGLSITGIRIEAEQLRFELEINAHHSIGWTVSSEDRALAGRFTPASATSGEEIFIRNGNAAALLSHGEGQWNVEKRQDGWIGGWNLGTDNRQTVGDLDGDGRDEILIRSPEWIGVLKWTRSRFESVTVQHDWVDGWNLGADNRELLADLDGDGAAEVYICSPEWAGVMKLEGGRLRLKKIHHDWIDDWNLGRDDREYVGRFSTEERDEIVIRSDNWIGLLRWDARAQKLVRAGIQHDWVDGWNLGPGDWHAIADVDGDGMDEIVIRSDGWIGVLKWQGGRFRVLWMTKEHVNHHEDRADRRMPLDPEDRMYAGRFRTDRDGVLIRKDQNGAGHYGKTGLYVLAWQDGEMKVVHAIHSHFNGRWNLGAGDRFVLGDFHRTGRDIALGDRDTVIDGLTDVFIHNGWGTGMVGVNHGRLYPEGNPNKTVSQIGLTWAQRGHLVNL